MPDLRTASRLATIVVCLVAARPDSACAQASDWLHRTVHRGVHTSTVDRLSSEHELSAWASGAFGHSMPETSPYTIVTLNERPEDTAFFSSALSHPALPPQPVSACPDDCWQWLPPGLMYHSYIAGEKEPRISAVWLSEKDRGMVWETAIGGRGGILRHGTLCGPYPEGWQLDVEGAGLVRIDHEHESDLEAVDFRVGMLSTWRRGPTALKAGYSHLSSHLGDEFLIRNPGHERINYVRDSVLVGVYHYVTAELAVYGEVAYAIGMEGGAEPLELQFGVEYRPIPCNRWNIGPVFAINGHLREEYDFGGSVNAIWALEARGPMTDSRFRIGVQYYNGKEIQWSFVDEDVQMIGAGLWFDY